MGVLKESLGHGERREEKNRHRKTKLESLVRKRTLKEVTGVKRKPAVEMTMKLETMLARKPHHTVFSCA